ncbi:PIN domain-containing protein [Dickeya oryzae]|uniref:PIN domain-containing protein n=1 Tax=Dickeya oryzae TaxID=1240404 RepID=A0AB39IQY0_9GAMM|nr:PIN domain-containing protein [Dickeya oryzae]MCA6991773.1 PIN domain-containing protein [Dickeya oryzae]
MDEIELNFGAITLDNATLKSEGYKFYDGRLAQMMQFKDSPVSVIQTDIVHNEAIKHIGQELSRARSSIDQALRAASKQLKIKNESINRARELLTIEGTEEEIVEKKLESYYASIGAEKIDSAKYIDLSVLMGMYFSTKAPFETGKDKKNEFPDAIALLSIEGWAERNNVNVIAVSQDNGWKEFSLKSNRITLVSSLAEALEKFQPHNKVASIISHIREDSLFDDDNHVLKEIENAIIDSINGSDIWIDADSSMYLEWEDVSASYISHELDNDDGGGVKIQVVRIDDESIVLQVGATVVVEVEASFDFSIKDSVDRDYVHMGWNVCNTKESYHTDILLTLTGDFSQDFDDIKVAEIEVLETITEANFGQVEPDWRRDYDNEES